MRIFMLGWEFPPFISGGLGTACYGLTKALSALGAEITFVLPHPVTSPFSTHLRLLSPRADSLLTSPEAEFRLDEFERVKFRAIPSKLGDPYARPVVKLRGDRPSHINEPDSGAGAAREASIGKSDGGSGDYYGGDMFAEVQRYAALATEVARHESFDVVHAHDWMTFPAGLAVARIKAVPLVVHVHSTEFDRSGVNVDTRIYDIERRGMHGASRIIAVSLLTKNVITLHYGIDPSKVEVVHNAVEINDNGFDKEKYKIHKDEKIVLFLGRMTMQKGPEYFLAASKKVLDVMDNVKFIMAGSGDLTRRTIEMAANMGIGHKVLFTGFLRGEDVERVFEMADLYVMPSVSEPFGIAPLEAMSHKVPVIVSKQSGVSEVVNHVLKVDFWDINEMANKIVAVLKHVPLARMLRDNGSIEVHRMSWRDVARKCLRIYRNTVRHPCNEPPDSHRGPSKDRALAKITSRTNYEGSLSQYTA